MINILNSNKNNYLLPENLMQDTIFQLSLHILFNKKIKIFNWKHLQLEMVG